MQESPGLVLSERSWPAASFPHRINFRSSKEGSDHIVQNWPGSNLVLDGLVRFWSSGSGPEASRCTKNHRTRFRQNATGPLPIPASDPVPFFHIRPGSYCTKQARIRFGSGWPYLVVAKQIRSGSKPECKIHQARFWQNATGPVAISGCDQTNLFRKQANVQESSGQPLPGRFQHVYWE